MSVADDAVRGPLLRRARWALLALLVAAPSGVAQAQVDFSGELVASLLATDAESDSGSGDPAGESANTVRGTALLRYLPELMAETGLGGETGLAFVAAGDFTATANRTVDDEWLTDADADLYRLWLRLASPRFQLRVGLQKISFGSATLLRPLQWFDRLDPRDPLQLTDGVWAGLFRYTAVNNTNLSLWVLQENDDLRGWDVVPSDPDEPEYGGRFQFPLLTGELALSYHHRRIDLSRVLPVPPPPGSATPTEQRLGLDGKWDVGIGLWFEGAVVERDTDLLPFQYRHLLTVGADYTFGLGSGLTALVEHFRLQESNEIFSSGEKLEITALSTSYRTSVVDQLSLIATRDWEGEENSFFFEWRRTYDRWRLHLIAFATPERGAVIGGLPSEDLYTGNGVQAMLVFNH